MRVAAGLPRAMHRLSQRRRRQRDDRRAPPAVRHFPDSNRGRGFDSVDDRHLDVHQHYVEVPRGEFVDRLLPIFGFDQNVGSLFQIRANQRAVVVRIVSHQDLQRPVEDRRRRRLWRGDRRSSVAAGFDAHYCAGSSDCREQLRAPHRFDDVVVDSNRMQARNLVGQIVGPEHHHDPRPRWSAAHQKFRNFDPSLFGHRAVEQRYLEGRLRRAVARKFRNRRGRRRRLDRRTRHAMSAVRRQSSGYHRSRRPTVFSCRRSSVAATQMPLVRTRFQIAR